MNEQIHTDTYTYTYKHTYVYTHTHTHTYTKTHTHMHIQYDSLIREAFKNEKSFINKLHKTFEVFVNANQRSPEYISLAMDHHLRGGKSRQGGVAASSEDQVEVLLEKALQMFR